jgi:hypothetical protein
MKVFFCKVVLYDCPALLLDSYAKGSVLPSLVSGSLVIEEERKRVLELKKRVQEEVKMQWENDHRKVCDELLSPSSETK